MTSPSKLHPRFWVSVWSDPKFAAEAEELALQIAGGDDFNSTRIAKFAGDEAAADLVLILARKVAEERIDLRRVREAQIELSRATPSQSFVDLVAAAKLTRARSPARSMILGLYQREKRAYSRLKKAEKSLAAARRHHWRRAYDFAERFVRNADARSQKAKVA
jgi:hypothetical protein